MAPRHLDRLAIGLITPVLTKLPRAHAAWERDATIEAVATIAQCADELGCHHLTCSEHVAVPVDAAQTRGARYWDPLATFGYLAARTTHVRFATHVLVLGYHHPLDIAKRYGTLDTVSAGRLVLGVGVGSLRDEFELLGAPFDGRGERADDALRAIRAAWGSEQPHYQGQHYAFDGFVIDPSATRNDTPIWIGGRTARSLRRAVELGDGWAPFALDPPTVRSLLDRARATSAWQARRSSLDVWLQPQQPLDPLREPTVTREQLTELVTAGATGVNARFVHSSVDHYCDQVGALLRIANELDVREAR